MKKSKMNKQIKQLKKLSKKQFEEMDRLGDKISDRNREIQKLKNYIEEVKEINNDFKDEALSISKKADKKVKKLNDHITYVEKIVWEETKQKREYIKMIDKITSTMNTGQFKINELIDRSLGR